MKTVDIIIPIYNAFDDLQVCLESLYQYTDLDRNRLILINDNSPDERIRPFLEQQKKRGNNVIVLHNEINRGFSNNINLGMAQSEENDVILLNSDTILTKRWVEKMTDCAYSHASIATVTPLSNNATLCSVPEPYEENTLPEGMSLEQAAEIIERHSMKKYPRIPVAVGFCMFIKREAIRKIGNFDAETFGRGYGEENDFCNRAEQAGYIHVMCDDTYIYHTGTKSFVSKEKEAYIREHEKILFSRYPEQMRKNEIYFRDKPDRAIADNVDLWFALENGRNNILYILHSDFRQGCDDNVGGTQFHVRDLVNGFRKTNNVFVLARDTDFLQLTAYTDSREFVFRFYVGKKEDIPTVSDRKIDEILQKVITGFGIRMVHVHHTSGTSMDIFRICEELQIPIYFTAHDFYSVCPNEKLLDHQWNYCEGGDCGEHCKECLSKQRQIAVQTDFLKLWRGRWLSAFKICDKVFAPSRSAKDIVALCYPEIAGKVHVIEHGVEYHVPDYAEAFKNAQEMDFKCKILKQEAKGFYYKIEGQIIIKDSSVENIKVVFQVEDGAKKYHIPSNFMYTDNRYISPAENGMFYAYIPKEILGSAGVSVKPYICYRDGWYYNRKATVKIAKQSYKRQDTLRIAFIGGLNKAKGAELAVDIIKGSRQDVEWCIFGGVGNDKLKYLDRDNVLKTNYYDPEDLPLFLRLYHIDLVCIFSLWPETYSYTLSETVSQGIPVVVSEIGALGERGRKYEGVSVVPVAQADKQAAELIGSFIENREQLLQLKGKIETIQLPGVLEMLDKYEKEYRQDGHPVQNNAQEFNRDIGAALLSGGIQDFNDAQFYQIRARLSLAEKELDRIYNSISYRMVLKILKLKIPFREELKRVLK